MIFNWERFPFALGERSFMTLPKSLHNYTAYLNKQPEKGIHIEPFLITGNRHVTRTEWVCFTWMLELQLPLQKRKLIWTEKAAILINDRGICHGFKQSLHRSENTINGTLGLMVKEGMWRRRRIRQHPTHLHKPFLGGGHNVNIEWLQKATENPEILD